MKLDPLVAIHREANHEIPDHYLNRWSPRAFTTQPVAQELLLRVLESARWAASSMNEQPWRFVVANTPKSLETFVRFLVPANQVWAREAPVLVLSLAKLTFTRNGKPNGLAAHDTGAASAYMALAATELGLHAHGMGGFDGELARELLCIPQDYQPMAVWALGYKGEPSQLSQELQARELPSGRKPLEELLVWGAFSAAEETPNP